MTSAWMLVALALAIVPLGSRGGTRLDALIGVRESSHDARGLGEGARVFGAVALAAGVVGAVMWLGGAVLGLAASAALATAAVLVRRLRARRAGARDDKAALEIVHLVRAEVEAGATAGGAVRAALVVGRFESELDALAVAVGHATDLEHELPAQLAPLAQALRVSTASGAPLAGVLHAAAAELQGRLDRAAAVATALAGARSSAVVLAVLPVVGLALGAALGADPVHVLLATSAGRMMALTGVVLECLGLLWTSRLAASAEHS